MPNDIVIELWHHGGHWLLKRVVSSIGYKAKGDAKWKCGLPPGMKPQHDAARAFRSGLDWSMRIGSWTLTLTALSTRTLNNNFSFFSSE
jgi:hypothetical protein